MWKLGNQRSELNPLRDRRQSCKEGPRLPWTDGAVGRLVQEVVTNPDGIEPEVLDRQSHVPDLRPTDQPFDLGKLDADGEGSLVSVHGHNRTGSEERPPFHAPIRG